MTSDSAAARVAGPDGEALAAEFDRVRPRLVRVPYAIVGSHSDAEDVAASCWPRLVAAHAREPIDDVGKWCTVAVARAAIDVLRSARKRSARAGKRSTVAGARPRRSGPGGKAEHRCGGKATAIRPGRESGAPLRG